jgi:hypothetical protein
MGGPRREAPGCANPLFVGWLPCRPEGGVCGWRELRYNRPNEIAEEGARCRPSVLPGSLLETATPWSVALVVALVDVPCTFPRGLNLHRATGSDWPAVSSNSGFNRKTSRKRWWTSLNGAGLRAISREVSG